MGNLLMTSLAYQQFKDSKKKQVKIRNIRIKDPVINNNKIYRWYNFIHT